MVVSRSAAYLVYSAACLLFQTFYIQILIKIKMDEGVKKKSVLSRYFWYITLVVIAALVVLSFVLVLIIIFFKRGKSKTEEKEYVSTVDDQKELEKMISANEELLAGAGTSDGSDGINSNDSDDAANVDIGHANAANPGSAGVAVVVITETVQRRFGTSHANANINSNISADIGDGLDGSSKIEVLNDDAPKEKIKYIETTEYSSTSADV